VLVAPLRDAPFTDPATGKTAFPVELLDASIGGEIYPPADHPGVLTVGDTSLSSALGPTADGRVKPDVILPATPSRFTGGDESAGSSNAAAYFAGVLAVLRAQAPGLSAGHVRAWVRQLDSTRSAALPQPLPAGKPVPPAPFRPGQPIPTNLQALNATPAAPLSPNSERALRYAESALKEPYRAPNAGGIIISTPAGTFTVQRGPRPAPLPAPATMPAQPVARAQAPDEPAASRRPTPPHATWLTPTPRQLAELVAR
jgi:hypothetical protein